MFEKEVTDARAAVSNQRERLRVGAGTTTRSLSSAVDNLDPTQPRPVNEGSDYGGPGLQARVGTLEMRINETDGATAKGFEHIDTRLKRIEQALGL